MITPKNNKRKSVFSDYLFQSLVILVGSWLIFALVAHVFTEIVWFKEVGYLKTLLKRWQTEILLWLVTFAVSFSYLWGNLILANRYRWFLITEQEEINSEPKFFSLRTPQQKILPRSQIPKSREMGLSWILGLMFVSALIIGLMVVYYGQTAWQTWHQGEDLVKYGEFLPKNRKIYGIVWRLIPYFALKPWLFLLVMVIGLLSIITQKWGLRCTAIILSLFFALVVAGNWSVILQYLAPTKFNLAEPQFGKDISFYIFALPLWQLIEFWFGGLCLYAFISVTLSYLLSGESLSEGRFPGFSTPQLRHLYALGGASMLTLALHHWLNRYRLLYSERGVVYGVGYTDRFVGLPLETVLSLLAAAIAIWLLWRSIKRSVLPVQTRKQPHPLVWIIFIVVVYTLIQIAGALIAEAVQTIRVLPNELEVELPYIERSIIFTRSAFALNRIDDQIFEAEDSLTAEDIKNNPLTIQNIRLWDTRPLLQTNRQLQQIRLYYKFVDADIDRYNLQASAQANVNVSSKQQVIISARELDYEAVPERAKTWVNKHLVYTHGYGFTMAAVNLVDEGGLPYYFVKDIGTETEAGGLRTSSKAIEASIPIGKPRIYYGELTNTYAITRTKVKELDFPRGEENAYNVYDGTGGVKIGNYARRLIFAQYLKDWQMLFTGNFTKQTKILLKRNIQKRIRTIAPFLRYDQDPYLVVANTQPDKPVKETDHLYWIIDAYTTSKLYPYSEPGEAKFNYIRNSVKVVIDAYDGTVDFYIADEKDPIVQTWSKIFPEMFQPLAAMHSALKSHIRYPQDLFSIQSERLLTYHMEDPQVFYNREDQWQIPEEIYGAEAQPVEPYYLIMKLPTAATEEFILLHPYTPTSRPNLIGWLAARSDGEKYGKLLLYKFPKQKLIYGVKQVEALINQDPVISQQISLWNREGSRAIQGNLLIIPIEKSLLYVEPLYIEAEQNSLPILARVIVVYNNKIVMAETLEKSLEAIFQNNSDSKSIIRPLPEETPILELNPNPEN